jgi:hypothetical protein
VESAYSKTFFTTDRIRALFLVESWAMSLQTRDLAHLPAKTLHVYGFLQCLNEYPRHANLLPAKGITLLQAKNLQSVVDSRDLASNPDFTEFNGDTFLCSQVCQFTDNRLIQLGFRLSLPFAARLQYFNRHFIRWRYWPVYRSPKYLGVTRFEFFVSKPHHTNLYKHT